MSRNQMMMSLGLALVSAVTVQVETHSCSRGCGQMEDPIPEAIQVKAGVPAYMHRELRLRLLVRSTE